MKKSKSKAFSPQEAAVISASVQQSEGIIDDKIKKINWLITGIVIVLFIAMITMLLTVAGIVIEVVFRNKNLCN